MQRWTSQAWHCWPAACWARCLRVSLPRQRTLSALPKLRYVLLSDPSCLLQAPVHKVLCSRQKPPLDPYSVIPGALHHGNPSNPSQYCNWRLVLAGGRAGSAGAGAACQANSGAAPQCEDSVSRAAVLQPAAPALSALGPQSGLQVFPRLLQTQRHAGHSKTCVLFLPCRESFLAQGSRYNLTGALSQCVVLPCMQGSHKRERCACRKEPTLGVAVWVRAILPQVLGQSLVQTSSDTSQPSPGNPFRDGCFTLSATRASAHPAFSLMHAHQKSLHIGCRGLGRVAAKL